MPALPTGTVTFVLTDVEGSTRLWEQHPDGMRAATVQHDAIVEFLTELHGGQVVRPRGEGDSRFCVFGRATDAVAAAAAVQRALHREVWPTPEPLRVRMALHTGEADLRDGDYYGPAVNRCARLRAIAHGGQTLLSGTSHDLVVGVLPAGAALRDLGEHRLTDLARSERVFQLVHSDLPADFPPLRSLDALPHNLPVQLTALVGRERELAELRRLLGGTRLLTLTGTGGCGKTRLALQAAAEALGDYPDGVWLAELAALSDPAVVPQTAAAALGVPERPGQAMLGTLVHALRAKRLLLVLDNCEHLIVASAELIDALLRGCPGVRVLATSREALGITGEVAWRVPSLPVPPPEPPPTVDDLTRYDAVRLFVDRAGAALPSFALTAQNASAVAGVCHRLDGIPLALELAAARVRGLSAEQIGARLDQRFRLLTGGSRTALPRQQTLAAAVGWSYDLLDPPERALLDRLAVFAGGFALEAAEAVCAGDGLAAEDVLELLLRLVDKSLVQAEEDAAGADRYRLLETIRQYARERLAASGLADAVYARHAAYYLALAEQSSAPGWDPEVVHRYAQLEREADNLRAALRWSAESGETEPALRVCGALGLFWYSREFPGAWRAYLEELVAAPGVDPRAPVRGRALTAVAELANRRGDYHSARRSGEEAVSILRAAGDGPGEVQARLTLSHALVNLGEHGRAQGEAEEGLQVALATGADFWANRLRHVLGQALYYQVDYAAAEAHLGQAAADPTAGDHDWLGHIARARAPSSWCSRRRRTWPGRRRNSVRSRAPGPAS